MEKKSNRRKNVFLLFILIIILPLSYYIITNKLSNQKNGIISNKTLKVLDSTFIKGYDDTTELIVKVQNISSQTFSNVYPYIIYYDSNNMPVSEDLSDTIGVFEPGSVRLFTFYNTVDNYSKIEIGLFDASDENSKKQENLKDKISYKVEKSEEDSDPFLIIKGQNNSEKNISVEFQVGYYSKEKLISADTFIIFAEANSPFESNEYLLTEYNDGTPFPAGYTYEVTIAQAVEYTEEIEEETDYTEISDEDLLESDETMSQNDSDIIEADEDIIQ